MGAAVAALGAGLLRTEFNTYLHAFLLAGAACVTIALVLAGSAYTGRGSSVAVPAE
jgi:hypothetical protein